MMRDFDLRRIMRCVALQISTPPGYWRQGSSDDENSYCVGDAIEIMSLRFGFADAPALWAFARTIAPEKNLPIGSDEVIDTIVDWNDEPGRTLEDVLAALDRTGRKLCRA